MESSVSSNVVFFEKGDEITMEIQEDEEKNDFTKIAFKK